MRTRFLDRLSCHPLRALATAVIVAVGFAAPLAAPLAAQAPAGKRVLTKWDTLAHDLFKELIEINTQESNGSSLVAAKAMAARLKRAGFPDSDVVVVENAPRKGNLIARLHGKPATKKPIMLLSHLDVVEAKPEDWTLPPFTFVEKDSTFYGRGVSDDKDDGAINLALLMRLKAEGFVPERDIIVALTTDEEGGPNNGVDWILKNRPKLLEAEYALNEGGGGRVKDGKFVSHDIQAAEKKVLNITLESTNPGGHSSVPVKDNAITHLSNALVKIGAFDFPVHLNDITREYFRRSASLVDPTIGWAMTAIAENETDVAAAAALAADPRYNSTMRSTCVATTIEGGHAKNALPQRAKANVNCRILPDAETKDIIATITKVIGDPKVVVTIGNAARNSPATVASPALMRELDRITQEMWPGVGVIPTMSTGATDGSYLRNVGIPTFGVSGQFYGDSNAHGMNEHIPQRAFYDANEFMYRLVKSLARPIVN